MLVYENGAKILDAALGILDAASNVKDITITYNVIIVSDEYAITIAAKDGDIRLGAMMVYILDTAELAMLC